MAVLSRRPPETEKKNKYVLRIISVHSTCKIQLKERQPEIGIFPLKDNSTVKARVQEMSNDSLLADQCKVGKWNPSCNQRWLRRQYLEPVIGTWSLPTPLLQAL